MRIMEDTKITEPCLLTNNVCRTCFIQNEFLIPIFDHIDLSSETKSISSILEECVILVISMNDNFPKKICSSCIEKLRDIYEFREMCKQSTANFIKLINSKNIVEKHNQDFEEERNNENENSEVISLKSHNIINNDTHINDDRVNYNVDSKTSQGKITPTKEISLLVHNGAKPYTCIVCSASFGQTGTLSRHMKIHKEFKHMPHVKNHMDNVADNIAFVNLDLNEDQESYGEDSRTSQEKETTTKKISFPCPICHQVFLSKYSMFRHKLIHTNTEDLICQICQKQFSRRSDVKRHMLIHNGTKPYTCIVCNASFGQTGTLSRHMRIHKEFKDIPHVKKRVDIKPHLCMICGKSFKVSSSLTTHMRRHMGEKSHKCTLCDRSFVCGSTLNNHMRIHTGERPFICAICGKSFSHATVLSRHMRIHENLKPFICDMCPKKFTTKYYLNIHKRQHTGEKPYKCVICFKLFADPKNFKHHMKVHLDFKPHKCKICGKDFRRKHHMTSHMSIH